MNRKGPIIIIEDDPDDQELFKEVYASLPYPNELIFFSDGQRALDFLNGEGFHITPFLIISDINLPKLSGFALRDKVRMDAALQIRCIPYLFFSTHISQKAVIDAYSLSVQGFFLKPSSLSALQKTVRVIMEYWFECASPNNFVGIGEENHFKGS